MVSIINFVYAAYVDLELLKYRQIIYYNEKTLVHCNIECWIGKEKLSNNKNF